MQLKHNNLSNFQHIVHKSFHFMTHHSLITQTIFKVFFLPDDYSLDIITLKQQQEQGPALKLVYYWITQNTKPNSLTPQILVLHFYMLIRKFSHNSSLMTLRFLVNFIQKLIQICLLILLNIF